jgi:outer membrane protein TolC
MGSASIERQSTSFRVFLFASRMQSMSLTKSGNLFVRLCAWTALGALTAADLPGQTAPSPPAQVQAQPSNPYQGSVPAGEASPQPLGLSLDDAIQRGLKNNLGLILSGTQASGARGQLLSQLQSLLPSVDFNAQENVMQVDLPAEGLKFPGFPKIIGPFSYTDLRAKLSWSLINVNSLRTYLAARHNFASAALSAQDAHDLVVLTVGNAYLLVLADQSLVNSDEAQAATAKVSLDYAIANHQAGTAPLLDELRARVDAQTIDQQLIVARNSLDKDKLALARVIGLPLEQKFNLSDSTPYALFDQIDIDAAIAQAKANRKDLAALIEQTKAAEEQRKAATADRYPTLQLEGDYGDIGTTLGHSHGTGDATGTFSVPLFKEWGFRGEAETAQSQLDTNRAQTSDLNAQVDADVRDALLDIASAQQQVAVAKSSVELANEELSEAQQRYKAGVSDNLAVSQAQASVAQANDQYVSSLYRHNVAKLSLARALGQGQNYKTYLGGK